MSVKFGFSKTITNRTLKPGVSTFSDRSSLGLEKQETGEKDYVDSISGTQINGRIKTAESKKELVIPLIQTNRWRIPSRLKNGETTASGKSGDSEKSLEQQAVDEILESTKAELNKDSSGNAVSIPLLLKNRIPTGFETDDNLDVSLRAEESTLDDYERVPVAEFGLAMLRGMGWKQEQGIGLKNCKVVNLIEPQLRPKGLGLGAERPRSDKDAVPKGFSKKDHKDREVLSLKIGAFVQITKGDHENNYGQVESFDEDNNRVIVKLANSSKIATVSKFNITLVSERDYSKSTKDSKRSRR